MTEMKCQSKTGSVEHSTIDPEYFKVTKIWGGRKTVQVECLQHAAQSELRGQAVELIR
jgi:hypothetical protein